MKLEGAARKIAEHPSTVLQRQVKRETAGREQKAIYKNSAAKHGLS